MRPAISKFTTTAALICAAYFSVQTAASATALGTVTGTTPYFTLTTQGSFQDLYTFSVIPNIGTVFSVNSDTFTGYGVTVTAISLYAGEYASAAELAGLTQLVATSATTHSDLGNGIFSHTVSGANLELSAGNIYTMAVSGFSQGNSAYTGIVAVVPVPEPETYAMLLAGMGLVGAVARRKKKARSPARPALAS